MKRSDDMAKEKFFLLLSLLKLPSLGKCMLREPWKRTVRFIKMKSLVKFPS